MTRETQWRREWDLLRAERSLARQRWRSAADGFAARARDPLGLGRLVRTHPVATTGIGAALAALAARYFFGGARAASEDASANGGKPRPTPVWSALLREAAVSVVVPWLFRTLKQRFGWDLEPAPAPEPREPAAASSTPRL